MDSRRVGKTAGNPQNLTEFESRFSSEEEPLNVGGDWPVQHVGLFSRAARAEPVVGETLKLVTLGPSVDAIIPPPILPRTDMGVAEGE